MAQPVSPVLGREPIISTRKHAFQLHTYRRRTLCAHCKQTLVKRGLRCKRCGLDVHDKCQEALQKQCIELILGHHNFRIKSYKQLTFCDYCFKLLVGVMNQGFKCSECGANVHDKCQLKIEVKCVDVKRRLQLRKQPAAKSGCGKNKNKRLKQMDSLSASLQSLPMSDTEMAMAYRSWTVKSADTTSLPGSPQREVNNRYRSQSLIPGYGTYELQTQVKEVTAVAKKNYEKIKNRGENLTILKQKSLDLNKNAELFKQQSKEASRMMWLKNHRIKICLATATILLIAIIILVIVLKTRST